jgi:hypothetical protein
MSVPAPLLAPAALAALRTALQRDFGSKAVSEALDLVGEGAMSRGDLAGADRQTRGGTTTKTLIRLLVLGLPVSEVAAGRALYPLSVNEAIGSGLLSRDADEVRAAIDVRPNAEDGGPDPWVVSDLAADVRPGVLDSEHVLGMRGGAGTTIGWTGSTSPELRGWAWG